MKIFLGFVKSNKKVYKAVTIYSNDGKMLCSFSEKGYKNGKERFDKFLDLFMWGIKKIKVLGQNNKISEDEKIYLFINSKTIYSWLQEENAPVIYADKFGDILLEMSFIVNEVEIIYSENLKLVLKEQEEYNKVVDLFG